MQIFEYFYFKNFKYNFINKFDVDSLKKLPKFKKLVLSFKIKTPNLKLIALHLLALEFISGKKSSLLTTSKKQNLMLKIKKGNPIGCKIFLSKKNLFIFLKKFSLNVLPLNKLFNFVKIRLNKNCFCFVIGSTILFPELEKFFNIFTDVLKLNVIIVLNTNYKEEIIFILKSFLILYRKTANVTQW